MTRWLPASLIIVVVLGVLWWLINTKLAPNQKPVVSSQESVISWQDVKDKHIGQKLIVEGKIVDTNDKNTDAWFLNFDNDYKTTLTVVIFAKNFSNFRNYPIKLYRGERIHVRGEINKHKDKLEIIVTSHEQIEIVE